MTFPFADTHAARKAVIYIAQLYGLRISITPHFSDVLINGAPMTYCWTLLTH